MPDRPKIQLLPESHGIGEENNPVYGMKPLMVAVLSTTPLLKVTIAK
jgi:hypothetical protein